MHCLCSAWACRARSCPGLSLCLEDCRILQPCILSRELLCHDTSASIFSLPLDRLVHGLIGVLPLLSLAQLGIPILFRGETSLLVNSGVSLVFHLLFGLDSPVLEHVCHYGLSGSRNTVELNSDRGTNLQTISIWWMGNSSSEDR